MASVRYPIALHGIDVLNSWASKGFARAARESEAMAESGKSVQFVSEVVGPKFETESAALDYYGAQYPELLEDARPGLRFTPDAADNFARLMCRAEPVKSAKRTTPVMAQGQRWPAPTKPVTSVWQLSLSYWKIIPKRVAKPAAGLQPYIQARAVRKKALGQALTPEEVQALAANPLMSYRPQKALDIGLFEFIPPDNPNIIIADE
ncbi:hypothetical protein OVA03_12080 [Asticcacaulis sp. SL142]|uniref:hypothetical protein n=1 Tax=Asticcacaulis sp. SL142 TaxID=2995155 RepID=UPI00226CBDFC|nr:hypothetical protein [Asticcacaulis sp. SL142]WAC47437.1 hypothetical protein OVA03_12080 [Asticcacaulis sp. SL142]